MRRFAKEAMPFIIAVALLILGTATVSMAGICDLPPALPAVPEIDPAMAASAVALIGGALLIIRGRNKK